MPQNEYIYIYICIYDGEQKVGERMKWDEIKQPVKLLHIIQVST